jgi:hypothetical protein
LDIAMTSFDYSIITQYYGSALFSSLKVFFRIIAQQ